MEIPFNNDKIKLVLVGYIVIVHEKLDQKINQ